MASRRRSAFSGMLAERVAVTDTAPQVNDQEFDNTTEPVQKVAQKLSLPRWKIVGGQWTNGLLVRSGRELSSEAVQGRLATGSVVDQLELEGDRLHYYRVTGSGPKQGWITTALNDRVLAELMDEMPALLTQMHGRSEARQGIFSRSMQSSDGATIKAPSCTSASNSTSCSSNSKASDSREEEPSKCQAELEAKEATRPESETIAAKLEAKEAPSPESEVNAAGSRKSRSLQSVRPHDIELEYSFQLPDDNQTTLRELADMTAREAGISVLRRDDEDSQAAPKAAESVAMFCFSPPTSPHGSQDGSDAADEYDFDAFNMKASCNDEKHEVADVADAFELSEKIADVESVSTSPRKVRSHGGA